MAEAFVIVDMKIHDPQRYQAYLAAAPATVKAHGGSYVVRGGRNEMLEGNWQPGRVAMLRFPSYEQAKAWYDGEGYRQAREHRQGTTDYFNVILVEGVAAPV